jgi:hypothetical protein
MAIPTEPIGSIPRPLRLIGAMAETAFELIRSGVVGTAMAAQLLGGR